jgi:hypothetical protein
MVKSITLSLLLVISGLALAQETKPLADQEQKVQVRPAIEDSKVRTPPFNAQSDIDPCKRNPPPDWCFDKDAGKAAKKN